MKALRVIARDSDRQSCGMSRIGMAVRIQVAEVEFDDIRAWWDDAPDEAPPQPVDIWDPAIEVLGEFQLPEHHRLQREVKAIRERLTRADCHSEPE